jgi:hypothetical protein
MRGFCDTPGCKEKANWHFTPEEIAAGIVIEGNKRYCEKCKREKAKEGE